MVPRIRWFTGTGACHARRPTLTGEKCEYQGERAQRLRTGKDALAEAEQVSALEFHCKPGQHRDEQDGDATG